MKNNYFNIKILLLLFNFVAISLSAQVNVEINKKVFKHTKESFAGDKEAYKLDKKAFKKVWKDIEAADYFFENDNKGSYEEALRFYLQAYQYNSENAALNYKIGVCYIKSIQKSKAVQHFEAAYQANPEITWDILYLMAQAYHTDYQFDKAEENYQKFEKTLDPNEHAVLLDQLNRKIQSCETAKNLLKKPVRVFLDNKGRPINSKFPDYSPLVSADESVLIFTSRRDNTTGGKIDPWDEMFYEDVYLAHSENGVWKSPINLGKPVNTKSHDATVGISPDGQQLIIYNRKNGGDLFYCTLEGDLWTERKAFPKTINTKFHEESASLSPDGKTLYFVSNKEDDSYGEHDIFVSTLDEKGKWGKAKNLSSVINSPYDEKGIFLHPDGRTIYFSSNGHSGMGGFDIFRSVRNENGDWSEPENLGYPINTPDDDIFFVISASGRHAYYSSEQKGGMGGKDLYMITFLGPEKPIIQGNEDNLIASIARPVSETIIEEDVEVQEVRLTILKGTVRDAITLEPIKAEIELVDNLENKIIAKFKSNSKTARFLISLPSGRNYGIAVKAKGYLFHSENFNIEPSSVYQEVNKDILLHKLSIGSKIVLRNIFFDFAKSTLRPESNNELSRLLKLLNEHNIRIEISGHTDNKGSKNYNLKLSKSRAKAVVDYLIEHGIDTGRLEFEGYGFDQPIDTNDTKAGRQNNRRVEFKIIE